MELQEVSSLQNIEKDASKLAEAVVHGIPNISFEDDIEMMRESEGTHLVMNLEYVFSEILLNALDHGRKRGAPFSRATIAAQYYPARSKLAIAIVDNGCGLFETLKSHPKMNGNLTDLQAIKIALQPRVSCNLDLDLGLDSRNQGIGLTVSSNMALTSNGSCTIFSGSGIHRLSSCVPKVAQEIIFWQGTGVWLEFDRGSMLKMDKGTVIRALPGFQENTNIVFE